MLYKQCSSLFSLYGTFRASNILLDVNDRHPIVLRNYESFIPSAEGILVVNYATPLSASILWPCLVCSVLVNSDFLTVNYSVK